MDNLPTLYKEHPLVTVVAHGDTPEIVRRLQAVRQDPEHIRQQVERYESFATLTKDDRKVLKTLKAVEEGRALISLRETLVRAGTASPTMHIPALALARPTMPRVRVRVEKNGRVAYRQVRKVAAPWQQASKTFFELSDSTFADVHASTGTWWSAEAVVPPCPPEVRQAHNLKDKDSYILFEAKWAKVNEHRPFTIDPALIQRVQGDVFAVLAVWELTTIEAAALA